MIEFIIEAETKTSFLSIIDKEEQVKLKREEIFSENYDKHIITWKIKDTDNNKYIDLGSNLSSFLEESYKNRDNKCQ